jgi:hypothetical protein
MGSERAARLAIRFRRRSDKRTFVRSWLPCISECDGQQFLGHIIDDERWLAVFA